MKAGVLEIHPCSLSSISSIWEGQIIGFWNSWMFISEYYCSCWPWHISNNTYNSCQMNVPPPACQIWDSHAAQKLVQIYALCKQLRKTLQWSQQSKHDPRKCQHGIVYFKQDCGQMYFLPMKLTCKPPGGYYQCPAFKQVSCGLTQMI